jgi:hypothetical protein
MHSRNRQREKNLSLCTEMLLLLPLLYVALSADF